MEVTISTLLLIFPEISGNIKFPENLQPYWKLSWLLANSVHTADTDKTRVLSHPCRRCELGIAANISSVTFTTHGRRYLYKFSPLPSLHTSAIWSLSNPAALLVLQLSLLFIHSPHPLEPLLTTGINILTTRTSFYWLHVFLAWIINCVTSIIASLFHSRLKTYAFNKSFAPQKATVLLPWTLNIFLFISFCFSGVC